MTKKLPTSLTRVPVAVLLVAISFLSVLEARADGRIASEPPGRNECRADFESHWDKGFEVAMRKRDIYAARVKELDVEISRLKNEPLWDVWMLRDIGPAASSGNAKIAADFLIAVKSSAGAVQSVIGSMLSGTGNEGAAQIVDASSFSAGWIVDQLKGGNTTISGLVESVASTEFVGYVAKEAVKGQEPFYGVMGSFIEGMHEGVVTDKQYHKYIVGLNDTLNKLHQEQIRTARLFDEQQAMVRDIIERGTTVFCENVPPVANPDEARALGRSYVDIHVLRNDEDPEKLPLALVQIQSAKGGRARTMDGGTTGVPDDDYVRFVADEGFEGWAEVRYVIKDDLGLQSTGIIRINVVPDPELADDFQDELDSILSDSLVSFDRQWSQTAESRLSALERRLEAASARLSQDDTRQSSFIDAVFQISRIGRDYKDIAALDCAEAMLNSQESTACTKFNQIAAREEIARALRQGEDGVAGTDTLGGLEDFTDPSAPDVPWAKPGSAGGKAKECRHWNPQACGQQ